MTSTVPTLWLRLRRSPSGEDDRRRYPPARKSKSSYRIARASIPASKPRRRNSSASVTALFGVIEKRDCHRLPKASCRKPAQRSAAVRARIFRFSTRRFTIRRVSFPPCVRTRLENSPARTSSQRRLAETCASLWSCPNSALLPLMSIPRIARCDASRRV